MRHDVYFPDFLPAGEWNFLKTRHTPDSGVGAEKIDPAEFFGDLCNKVDDFRFIAHIGFNGEPVNFGGHEFGLGKFKVGNNHGARPLGSEAVRERASDSPGSPGDDCYFVLQIHLDSPAPN